MKYLQRTTGRVHPGGGENEEGIVSKAGCREVTDRGGASADSHQQPAGESAERAAVPGG